VSLPQAVRPAISQVQANAPAASPTRVQSPSAPASPQVQAVPQTSSGTITVEYRNGLLSVVAEKAELGKVLQLLGAKIGTSIEVAPEITAEPVVAHIKAAAPAQVLAQLLDGPQLEYIVMGADETGRVLNRVVVRKRNSFARQPLVAVKAPTEAGGAAK
jgi:type II secretory pathway component GspD/PulD (secretin)